MDELVINYNNSPLETLSVKAVATVKNVLIYLTYWLTKRMKASKTIFTVDAFYCFGFLSPRGNQLFEKVESKTACEPPHITNSQ